MISAYSGHTQDMLKQFNRFNNKLRVAPGLLIGEPLGLSASFYRGANCKSRRSWTFTVYTGMDGTLLGKNSKDYNSGKWEKGSWQFGGIFYMTVPREVMRKHSYSWLYNFLYDFNLGVGLQAGKRAYIDNLNSEDKVNNLGVVVTLN